MFGWIDDFYARLRPSMPEAQQRFLDVQLEYGGYGMIFGDCIEFAAARKLIDDDDRRRIEEILDFGLLRKCKPYFMDLIAP
ncbi:hypothetical protein [Tessaracoccus palaemonis]|uniref:DUF1048 domain-containing protein n=1 Tax=Tessaracoccus palaemonis TaxID=2829499 RepID=A0ABX8SMJ9_9ACTN|nr:hypothetical protein [Tessaracoccus palaemonis]QXT64164.1 hypothetical protein KDB89_06875 [Tessaracoccus palaemonis]